MDELDSGASSVAEEDSCLCAIKKEIEKRNDPSYRTPRLPLSPVGSWDTSTKILAGWIEVKMQIPGAHPRLTESEFWGLSSGVCILNKLSR